MLNFWSSDKQWREGNFWWVIGKRDDVAGKGERKNMSFLFPHPIPARSISNIAAWWMIPAFNLCTLITAGYGYGHLILGGEVFKARFCLNFENLVKTLSQHVITNGFPPLGTSCLHTVLIDLNILKYQVLSSSKNFVKRSIWQDSGTCIARLNHEHWILIYFVLGLFSLALKLIYELLRFPD